MASPTASPAHDGKRYLATNLAHLSSVHKANLLQARRHLHVFNTCGAILVYAYHQQRHHARHTLHSILAVTATQSGTSPSAVPFSKPRCNINWSEEHAWLECNHYCHMVSCQLPMTNRPLFEVSGYICLRGMTAAPFPIKRLQMYQTALSVRD